VSLPERRYDLAGRILAEAVTAAQRSSVSLDRSLHEAAGAAGRAAGEAARASSAVGEAARASSAVGEAAAAAGRTDPLDAVSEVLTGLGYEPRVDADCIVLGNCPFHSLAENYTDVVWGINLDLITAILRVPPAGDAHARLDPAPGRCCVTIRAGDADRD
jgi:predicted ArsR family transcriptional regulator